MSKVQLGQVVNIERLKAVVAAQRRQVSDVSPEDLAEKLRARVKGQDHVIVPLCDLVCFNMARKQKGRPVAVVVIAGPPSTGKTELAKALAQVMYGDEKFMLRIDCGEYAGMSPQETMAGLFGSDAVYKGAAEGKLSSKIKATKKGIILFDEIEKMVTGPESPMAMALYSMFDEARITDKHRGETIDCSEFIIFCTSNAEETQMRSLVEQFRDDPDTLATQCKVALTNKPFPNALITRINMITSTAPLDEDTLYEILAMKMGHLVESFPGLSLLRSNDESEPGIDPMVFYNAVEWLKTPPNTLREFESTWFKSKADRSLFDVQRAGASVVRLVWDESINRGQPGIRAIAVENAAPVPGVDATRSAQQSVRAAPDANRLERTATATATAARRPLA